MSTGLVLCRNAGISTRTCLIEGGKLTAMLELPRIGALRMMLSGGFERLIVLPPPETSSPEEFSVSAMFGPQVREMRLQTYEGFAEGDPQPSGAAIIVLEPVAIGAMLYVDDKAAGENADIISAIEAQLPYVIDPAAPRVVVRGQVGTLASSLLVIVPRSVIKPGATLLSMEPTD